MLEARWRSLVPWLNPAPNQALEPTASSFGSAALRLRFRRRLTAGVRWPARRVVGGALSLRAAVWIGGWRGSESRPSVRAVRGSAGRPGRRTRWSRRASLPPPNNALEPTAPSGRVCLCARRDLGAAAHRERSVARAAGSGRRIVPTSSRVARRLEGLRTRAGCRGHAGRRRAPWERDPVPRRGPLPPPNNALERTGHSVALVSGVGLYLWPAAHRERSVARAAGGGRRLVPTSSGVGPAGAFEQKVTVLNFLPV